MQAIRAVAIALALLFCAVQIEAQDTTGKITGTVTDPSGSVVPSVKVTVTHTATGISHTTTTDQSGTYQVLQLPIGLYSVTAVASGFKTVTVDSKTPLEINQTLHIDVKLEIGQVSSAIEVQSNATMVETETRRWVQL
jgi:hypothetical protein